MHLNATFPVIPNGCGCTLTPAYTLTFILIKPCNKCAVVTFVHMSGLLLSKTRPLLLSNQTTTHYGQYYWTRNLTTMQLLKRQVNQIMPTVLFIPAFPSQSCLECSCCTLQLLYKTQIVSILYLMYSCSKI